MIDAYTDEYWETEFDLAVADVDRLAEDLKRTRRAYLITEIAHKLVQLHLAGESKINSNPTTPVKQQTRSVRWWDQVDNVFVGDQLIVLHGNDLVVQSAEVTAIESVAAGIKIHVFLPETKQSTAYIKPNDPEKWNRIRNNLREKRFGAEKADIIEQILTRHGEKIIGPLVSALGFDERFTQLSGRWFLKTQASSLSPAQIKELAWSLLEENDVLSTEDLAGRITGAVEGDGWLFGVYLALQEHPELFRNVNPGPQPRWELAGPPPGTFTPQHGAYDPQTYEVIAQPEVEADQRVVRRLWDLDLLDAVV